jgi:hypothetical protein
LGIGSPLGGRHLSWPPIRVLSLALER